MIFGVLSLESPVDRMKNLLSQRYRSSVSGIKTPAAALRFLSIWCYIPFERKMVMCASKELWSISPRTFTISYSIAARLLHIGLENLRAGRGGLVRRFHNNYICCICCTMRLDFECLCKVCVKYKVPIGLLLTQHYHGYIQTIFIHSSSALPGYVKRLPTSEIPENAKASQLLREYWNNTNPHSFSAFEIGIRDQPTSSANTRLCCTDRFRQRCDEFYGSGPGRKLYCIRSANHELQSLAFWWGILKNALTASHLIE